jgi:subtilisin-like proprotein convertase family protein
MVRRVSRRAARRVSSPSKGAVSHTLLEALEGRRLLSATISGTAFNDPDGNALLGPAEGALAGRTVFLDLDGNGLLASGTATVPSTNVPLAIPDNFTSISNNAVSGLTGVITDVNVSVNITHTYDSDLAVDLVSPTGQRIRLFSNVGGSGENFTGTLDDEAATAVTAGTAPFSGSYRPIGPLSTFDGLGANGTWRLEVADTVELDSGTLNSWSLTISTGEPTATTDSAGAYSFTVAPGSYSVRQVLPAGWVGTTPAGGAHAVTAVDGQTYSGRDFGSGLADAPPVATLVSAPNVTAFGGSAYYYSVRYGDAVYVDYQSIVAGRDTQVTGPGGFSAQGTLANLSLSGNQWTATYVITPPGGTWNGADVGTYTISLRDNEVSDLTGHFTPAGSLGTFTVSDPPPTAELISAPNISVFGGTSYYYTVRYDDNVFVDYTGIISPNATTVTGPNGFSASGTLANLSLSGKVWTATYTFTAPGGTWNPADVGTYTISLNPNQVKDLAGNFTPGGTLGTFTVSDTPPTAALASAPNVSAFGGTTYYFSVLYNDNQFVDYHTILAGNDTQVTGPGFATPALSTLASLTLSGSTWTATYYVTAPGGTWDVSDAGTYTVALRANEVADVSGNFAAAATLGTFTVSDPPPTETLVAAPNVTAPGGSIYYYTVNYADNTAVDYTTFSTGNDTLVSGPGGFSALGTLANLTYNAGVWGATYFVTAPGGTWDAGDAGTYTISMRANEVKDTAGNFTPAGTLGTFQAFPPGAAGVGVAAVSTFSTVPIVPSNALDLSTGKDVLV